MKYCHLSLALLLALQLNGQGLSAHAGQIKAQVSKLSKGEFVSVIPYSSKEVYGTFVEQDKADFRIRDIDANQERIFSYDEVEKIKHGMGGYNSVQQRHVDRTKQLLIVGAVAGVLVAVVVAATTIN